MRILILHSRYLSDWASGENSVVRDEERLLIEAGHEVLSWTPHPEPTVSHARLGSRAVWSPAAVDQVHGLLRTHRPDIVHVHNLFPMLSPAVLRASRDGDTGLVVTLHNYRMLCLPATCIRDGEICELCVGHIPWRGVVHRCYRGSVLGSAALATSLTAHRAFGTFDHVSLFLPVSGFVRDKHLEAGFSRDRMWVKPNFCWPRPRRDGAGDYFLYAGRLAPEKDVRILLEAWRGMAGYRLIVVGDGPEMEASRSIAPPGVEFRGTVEPEEVSELLTGARALVVPTRCNEGGPRSVIEAYSAGVPVIATKLGGITEMIEHGVSGMLVPPRRADAWVEALDALLDDSTALRLGDGAFDLWRREYGPDTGLERLERAYRAADPSA